MTLTTKVKLLFVLALISAVPVGVVAAYNFGLAYLLIVCSAFLSIGFGMFGESLLSQIASTLWLAVMLFPTVALLALCANGGNACFLAAILETSGFTTVLLLGPPIVKKLGVKAGDVTAD